MASRKYDLLFDEDGDLIYAGEINIGSGLPDGQGTAFDDQGNMVYEGEFDAGDYEGEGKEFYPGGRLKYHGQWQDDYYHGTGVLFDRNGAVIHQGRFSAGKPDTGEAPKGKVTPTVATDAATAEIKATKRQLDQLLAELNGLIGLAEVKKEVTYLVNLLKAQKLRTSRGLPQLNITLHMVLTGNPGTGKTTVARLIGKILGAIGYLKKGHIVEVDRAGLVGGYIGQTALKVQEVVTEALGGVLFIDEAYNLVVDDQDSYGKEAVATLLKMMEDHRDDLVVIIAGYEQPIRDFIKTNPGFESRFGRLINFADYNPAELVEITEKIAIDGKYRVVKDARLFIQRFFELYLEKKPANFSNARFSRNFYEKAVLHHANRIVTLSNPTDQQLVDLELSDFRQVLLNKELISATGDC